MVAHDYNVPISDCPACQRLLQITHNFSKPPSECPGCLEAAAIRGGYVVQATSNAEGASAHHAAIIHCASATPATAVSDLSHDLISTRARHAASEAVQQIRRERVAEQSIAASWDLVIQDLNRDLSPSGTVSKP
jgi:hypothetical protein